MKHFGSTFTSLIKLRNEKYISSPSLPSGLWKNWLDKLSYVMELSEARLQHIRLHVDMGFFIGATWSRLYYEANEIRLGLKTLEESNYIKDYERLTKGVDKALHLSELDPLRNEIAIPYQNHYITEDVLRAQCTISNLRHFPAFDSCIEIGAGYGALANQIIHVYGTKRYTVIDYPEILFYIATWSQIVHPHLHIAIFDGTNHEQVNRADLVLIPNFLQPEIQLEADLLINENSFCEMTETQVNHYLRSSKLRYQHLYSNNRDRQFMNRDLRGLNAILGEHFNLSPTLDEYKNFYRDTPPGKHWNMKYIFLASKDKPLAIDIQALHGLTIRTQH